MANEKKPKVEEDIAKSVKELSDINKSLKKLVAIKNLEKYGRTPEQRKQKRGWEKEKATTEKMLEESRGQSKAQTVNQKLSEKFHVQERKDRMKIMKDVWKKQTVGGASPAFATQAFKNQRNIFTKLSTTMKQMGGILKPTGAGGSDKDKNPMKNAMMGVMKFAVGGSIVGMLGKKLFDSSPLLKTMMSLFNTSIMLIFRPIGDFIGSFLRPIMLFFMKNIAIPFYKNSKHAMGFGEKLGRGALGFLLKPGETMYAALVRWAADIPVLGGAFSEQDKMWASDYSGIADWQLNQAEELGLISESVKKWADTQTRTKGWGSIQGWINAVMQGNQGSGGQQFGITPTATSSTGVSKAFETEAAFVVDVFENGNSELAVLDQIFAEMVASGQYSQEQIEMVASAMRRSVLAGNSIENAFTGILTGLDKMAKEIAQKAKSYYEAKAADPAVGSGNINMNRGKDIMNAAENFLNSKVDYGKFSDINAVPKPASRGYSNPQAQIARAQEVQQNLNKQKSATFYGQYSDILADYTAKTGRFAGKSDHEASQLLEALTRGGKKGMVGDAGQRLLNEAANAVAFGQVKGGNDKEARLRAQKYQASLNLFNTLGINSLGKAIKPQMGDLVTGKGAVGYANGGLITEPIFGVGRSGQTYTFGERGQETVTPGKGGTNYILNINVGNVTREADFDKLKPLIQRWILEANSRRGVV